MRTEPKTLPDNRLQANIPESSPIGTNAYEYPSRLLISIPSSIIPGLPYLTD